MFKFLWDRYKMARDAFYKVVVGESVPEITPWFDEKSSLLLPDEVAALQIKLKDMKTSPVSSNTTQSIISSPTKTVAEVKDVTELDLKDIPGDGRRGMLILPKPNESDPNKKQKTTDIGKK